ncbi:MAG: hypothetical protein PWQ82_320 [Thermosediminibacterales bacterium]|nr:hypothetical protein [Thermosediminibacterales bacterium]
MFGKKNGTAPPAVNTDKVDTVIGKGTEIKGTLNGTGVLRIDGKVEGEININGDLVIGETGKVMADINARHVTAAGEITGNISAEGKLEIISTGKVYGDINVMHLVINDGAVFEGKCEMNKKSNESEEKRG